MPNGEVPMPRCCMGGAMPGGGPEAGNTGCPGRMGTPGGRSGLFESGRLVSCFVVASPTFPNDRGER